MLKIKNVSHANVNDANIAIQLWSLPTCFLLKCYGIVIPLHEQWILNQEGRGMRTVPVYFPHLSTYSWFLKLCSFPELRKLVSFSKVGIVKGQVIPYYEKI